MNQLFFSLIVLEKYRILGCMVIEEILDKYRKYIKILKIWGKYRNIGSFDKSLYFSKTMREKKS
jgi:hypothetical protein